MLTPAIYRERKNVRVAVRRAGESANLTGDQISGKFSAGFSDLFDKPGGHHAIEFANWPDSAREILRFTRKYGPLEDLALAQAHFSFDVQAFRGIQAELRNTWQHPETVMGLDTGAEIHFRADTV